MRAAERQLLALADWLLGLDEPEDLPVPSAAIAAAELLAADLDLRTVAARAGVSYDLFRHRFNQELGESPIAFRNRRRLRSAANLLRKTHTATQRASGALPNP